MVNFFLHWLAQESLLCFYFRHICSHLFCVFICSCSIFIYFTIVNKQRAASWPIWNVCVTLISWTFNLISFWHLFSDYKCENWTWLGIRALTSKFRVNVQWIIQPIRIYRGFEVSKERIWSQFIAIH